MPTAAVPDTSPPPSQFVATFKQRVGSDALSDRLAALESLSWPQFDALPESQKLDLTRIAAANADAGSVRDDDDVAFSVATAVLLLEMVDAGRLPPAVLSSASFVGVVHSLDAAGLTMDDMPSISDRVASHQAGITTLGVLNAFDLKGASFSERAAGIQRLREIDRRYSGDDDGSYDAAAEPGWLLRPTYAPPISPAQPTGLEAAVHAIGTVSNRVRALIDLTQNIKGTGNEAELAGINAELKLLQSEMDILLGLIDQLTSLFEKVGRAFAK